MHFAGISNLSQETEFWPWLCHWFLFDFREVSSALSEFSQKPKGGKINLMVYKVLSGSIRIRGDVTTEAKTGGTQGWGHELRRAGSLWELEETSIGWSPRAPRRNTALPTL